VDDPTYSKLVTKRVMEDIKEHGFDTSIQKKEPTIPPVGKKILIERNWYEVIYINIGRRRFTCKSSDNLPELNKIFMFEGEEYIVSHIDINKGKFTCSPYGGQNDTRTTNCSG
jgi:hypothetical protein